MWNKKPPVTGIPPKITSRAQVLERADLTLWADQAISIAGRYLTMYQRSGDPAHLYEAQTGAQVLLAIVEEIRRRDGR